MKTKPFFKFPILLGLSALSIFQSCEKENSGQSNKDEDGTEMTDTVITYEVLITEELKTESIFLDESLIISQINLEILNGIGLGFDTIEHMQELSIFQIGPRDSIVKFTLNESESFTCVYSFDKLKSNRAQDSLTQNKIISDSSFVLKYIPVSSQSIINQKSSTLYVNLIYKKMLGKVQIDIENKALNEYLRFKSSIIDSLDNDEITISAENFRNTYGDLFCNAITLGVYLNVEFELSEVTFEASKQAEILEEASALFAVFIKGNSTWEALRQGSSYFSQSNIFDMNRTEIPRFSIFDDAVQNIVYLDSIYKKMDVGVLSMQYKPYSYIYPKFDFYVDSTGTNN